MRQMSQMTAHRHLYRRSFGDAGHVVHVLGSIDDAMDSRHHGGQAFGRNRELGDSADLRR
jgi:hypothetical protein